MTADTAKPYPRDLVGYGRDVPHARWPGKARIAVQFVLNYEEGGENNVLHGDPTSETFLSELVTAQAYENRHMTMESMYEYGSRVGVWRILREFEKRQAAADRLRRRQWRCNAIPDLTQAFMDLGHEIASHGFALDPLPEPARGHRAPPHGDMATHVIRDMTNGVSGRWAGTPGATAPTPTAW